MIANLSDSIKVLMAGVIHCETDNLKVDAICRRKNPSFL